MLVALSSSSPPYSSGVSIISSPSSPHFFISSTISGRLCCSSSLRCGITSLKTNCSVVAPICRCSALKSSGVKTSSLFAAVIRYSAPLNSFTAMVPSCVVYCCFCCIVPSPSLALPRWGRLEGGVWLHPLEYPGGTHAAADAHRYHAVAGAGALHLVEDAGGQLGPGAAERMAEGDCPAVDVD